jgi:hypothetical protein
LGNSHNALTTEHSKITPSRRSEGVLRGTMVHD